MGIKVIYWSQTGNTEEMAKAVANGIESSGKSAEILPVSSVTMADIIDDEAFAIGCPAMGAEVLEEGEMEPFVSSIEGIISGKKLALFGSYGWGDGQWMRDFEERMANAGAIVVSGQGIICCGAPDDTALTQCEELGKNLVQ